MRGITVVADTSGFALLCLYAGLRRFARVNSVPLKFTSQAAFSFQRHWPGSLWIEVQPDAGKTPVFVCIDMADAGFAFALERLERCDLYFKRSFERHEVARLPAHLAEKVLPYGIFYEAMDSADGTLLRRVICEYQARKRFGAPLGKREFAWWARLLAWTWLDPVVTAFGGRHLVVEDQVVARSGAPLGNTVCFQTRLWSPDEVPREKNIQALNDGRAAIVRALKDHLGAAYIGGVMRSEWSLQHYGELITPHASDRAGYLKLLQQSRVSVVTTGIHRSVPGKLGESLAAGRCIVTEPLAYEFPVPLEEGKHYLTFTTAEECVAQCRRLLEDDATAAEMQARNREYYSRHGALPVTIDRCLRRAEEVARTRNVVPAGGMARAIGE